MKNTKPAPIIKLSNISKAFRVKSQDLPVLNGVNLEINAGDFTMIVGPSGCGKSTLLHTIIGLEPPTTGTVTFLGKNLYNYSEDIRSDFRKQNIGVMYQQTPWIRSITVAQNVAFVATLLGMSKLQALEKAIELLKTIGMEHYGSYFPMELSSGQQQKIALARALITNPQVIIADEPTGNLDYHSGQTFMKLLKEFSRDKGKTIIMVTHDANNIDFSTKVIQMFDGNIVKSYDTDQDNLDGLKRDLLKTAYVPKTTESIKASPIVAPLNTFTLKRKQKLSLRVLKYKILAGIRIFTRNVLDTLRFTTLLVLYISEKLFTRVSILLVKLNRKFVVNNNARYLKSLRTIITKLANDKEGSIKKEELIDLSIQHMRSQKARSAVTIGGMALGIGIIVVLVSIGYGLEQLVISRISTLAEMQQTEVYTTVASNIKISDKALNSYSQITNVRKVLPVIGVVGKTNYKGSISDIAVYGVQSEYLSNSAIPLIRGKYFDSNETNIKKSSIEDTNKLAQSGEVKGVYTASAKYLDKIRDITFKIAPEAFIRVRESPDSQGTSLGYTRYVEGIQEGTEYWGKPYMDTELGTIGSDPEGATYGIWIKAKIPLWEQKKCSKEIGCEQGEYVPLKDNEGSQIFKEGYFAIINTTVNQSPYPYIGQVLGLDTENSNTSENTENAGIQETTPISESTGTLTIDELLEDFRKELIEEKENIVNVALDTTAPREAVVNNVLLSTLDLTPNKAIGETIKVQFVATSDLLSEDIGRVVSNYVDYKIVGVVEGDTAPVLYIPIVDLKQLGITNYSQATIVAYDETQIPNIRKQIEIMGYKTSSVQDTVNQVNRFFKTIRILFGLLGTVALTVAAMGMFNTLTVSLLERTREVGMMKVVGMKSDEIHDLFLTESIIMAFLGGIGGLLGGYLAGNLLSIILSIVAIMRGDAPLDITYIPIDFFIFIVILAVIVGVITGIYPAKRAAKIPALDALRYE